MTQVASTREKGEDSPLNCSELILHVKESRMNRHCLYTSKSPPHYNEAGALQRITMKDLLVALRVGGLLSPSKGQLNSTEVYAENKVVHCPASHHAQISCVCQGLR